MYLVLISIPLISTCVSLLLGRWIGTEGVKRLPIILMGVTWIIALRIFKEVVIERSETYITLWRWVLGDIGFQFDALTGVMLVVVTSISGLVHLYSSEYMGEDPHLPRFMSYLSLFTWFMIILVTADNLLLLFVGWEGVGLCSYLLINFWYTRIEANKAAMKAMIVNRIGDVGVVLGIVICYLEYKSVKFSVILPMVTETEATAIGLMLLIGAMGKSAQLGLHTWLPDAMEGPTPVSALIHAATMVTAGVFLLLRMSPIIERSAIAMSAIAIIGALTAFFAATVGLVQNDIKKVIAYSTCSQLGYMVLACGVGGSAASLFHLYNHAFFKALLFLSAGAVIHAIADEQDLRKMGSLIQRLPMTYTMILVGSLSLMGIPFLTGFYSKDAIIEIAYVAYSVEGSFGHWLGSISAMMTAFYSLRLINLAFTQSAQGDRGTFENAHEPSWRMSVPLVILSIASISIGYLSRDIFIGPGSPFIELETPIASPEYIPTWIKLIPVTLSFVGAAYGMVLYPLSASHLSKSLFTFLSSKWHFDQLYGNIIVNNVLAWGHNVSYKLLDRGIIEWLGPTGLTALVTKMARKHTELQTGRVFHLSITILIGTVLAILVF